MKFNDVLLKLKLFLEENILHTNYDVKKEKALPNEVLIGLGSIEAGGILLNNKVGGQYISVSEYLFHQPDHVFVNWKTSLSDPELPELAQYYIEDMSADTCLAFILFYARLHHVPVSELPFEWIQYVNRWKSGDVTTTGTPFESWGALLNALSHDYYEYKGDIRQFNTVKIQNGFKRCLLFTIELLLKGHHPASVPPMHQSEGYHRATTILQIEKQEYEHVLKSAEKIQLELPIRDSERRVLVDCLIVTQVTPLGTLKNFSRTDTQNSYFNSGFGLLALHQPNLPGTGHDMSVSVDPYTGTHLQELWSFLEELENERWENNRPIFPQRPGYNVNQPWFNGYSSTLIAAPKFITKVKDEDPDRPIETDQLGSKLNWHDVQKALWKLYNPIKNIEAYRYLNKQWENETIPVSDLAPIIDEHQKRFIAFKPNFTSKSNYIFTPTFKRYLVALLMYGKRTDIGINELPSEKSFYMQELPGGFALIHEQGVVFLDDWTKDDSEMGLYIREFQLLTKRYGALSKLKARINREMKVFKTKMSSKRQIRKQFLQLTDELAKLKLELRTVISETISSSKDFHLQVFREEVERRWGLNTQLDDLYQTVQEVEATVKNMVETRTNRVLNAITIMGFPIALFAGIFQDSLTELIVDKQPDWGELGLFVGLTAATMYIFQNWIDRK